MTNIVNSCSVFRVILRSSFYRPTVGKFSTKSPAGIDENEYVRDDDKNADLAYALQDSIDVEAAEAEIERKRNKSGLAEQDRRVLNGRKPYDEPQSWIHNTLRYHQVMYARYGEASGVDCRLLFPTAEDRDEKLEYEQVAYPKTLKQMIAENEQRRLDEKAEEEAREREILQKLGKLNQWKKDLNEKIAKREAIAKAAIEKKARLVDEIRRQFGFKMDSRDPRFEELLEKKMAYEKKVSKAAKKSHKEAQLMQRLMQMAQGDEKAEKVETKPAPAAEATDGEIRESLPQKRGKKNKP